ncbi:MAG: hypothetical protein VW405_07580, partial [Rhodospirillaceae bacterium]
RRGLGLLGMGIAALCGCQTVQVVVLEVAQVPAVNIANASTMATVTFDRVGFKIRRGTPIGTYDPDILGLTGWACLGGNIFWNQGRVVSRSLELADLFFEEIKTAAAPIFWSADRSTRS